MASKIWKKLSAISLIGAIVLCFSGCIRYNASATFYKDGDDRKVDIKILYATVDMSQYGDGEGEVTTDDDELEGVEDLGWEVEEYDGEKDDDQTYIGCTISKEGIDVEDLEDELKALNEFDLGFEKFTFEIDDDDLCIIDWDVSSNSDEATNSGVSSESLAQYGGYMKFVLELPDGCEDENSTDSKGNTFEWDFFQMEEPIHAEFYVNGSASKGGFPTWIIFVIIGAVVVIAAVVVVLLLLKKKKGGNGGDPVAVQPNYASTFKQVVPQAPVAPAPFAPQAPAQDAGFPQAPAAPVAPAVPVAPVAPAAPVAPVAPVAPETPAFPDPTAPQDPNAGL